MSSSQESRGGLASLPVSLSVSREALLARLVCLSLSFSLLLFFFRFLLHRARKKGGAGGSIWR